MVTTRSQDEECQRDRHGMGALVVVYIVAVVAVIVVVGTVGDAAWQLKSTNGLNALMTASNKIIKKKKIAA